MRPRLGADALLIVTPYYTRPPQRGMIAYYLEVMKGIDLPWMIYHIPGRAAVDIKIDTVKELRDKSPNFRRHEACFARSRFRHRMPRGGRALTSRFSSGLRNCRSR